MARSRSWAWGALALALTATACGNRRLSPLADGGYSMGILRADAREPSPSQPPAAATDPGAPVAPVFVRQPATSVPFACDPLPPAFFFPPLTSDAPGSYSRYASYEVGPVSSLAVSPDGRRALLITGDGIGRLIEVGSRRVVGLLAPARATLGLAAFSPSGDSVVTVARGEREATLWRADSSTQVWTVVWTVGLPGQRYDNSLPGSIAFTSGGVSFSPEGRSVVVSPGRGVFRLDVATGEIRASWTDASNGPVVGDLSFAWDGRRVVMTQPSLVAHCQHRPNGGTLVLLDPEDLHTIQVAADWGAYPGVTGQPAFRASASGDILLAAGSSAAPQPRAFRLSDGSALPAPALSALPLALVPGGDSALVAADRELRLVRIADGAVLARTAGTAGGPVAVSADAGTVLVGGQRPGLLGVWNPADGVGLRPVCSADASLPATTSANAYIPVSLSAGGDRLAVGWGAEVRVLRADDGSWLQTFASGGDYTAGVQLAPDGSVVLARPFGYPQPPPVVFRVGDGARLADFGSIGAWTGGGTYWSPDAVFAPDDRSLWYSDGNQQVAILDLTGSGATEIRPISGIGRLLGFSGGCPVLQDYALGITRSCATCDDPPFAPGSSDALLSPGGRWIATRDAYGGHPSGVTIYRMPPQFEVVRQLPARLDAPGFPLAITRDGARLLLGAAQSGVSCSFGPAYEVQVIDLATGALLDALPPGIQSVDADARTLAYGAQVWRARD